VFGAVDRISKAGRPEPARPAGQGSDAPEPTPTAPLFIDIDGKRYLWRELVEGRKAQVKEAAIREQPTLFEMHADRRPPGERSAAERYESPSLFSRLER
jgi:hypothetical protein